MTAKQIALSLHLLPNTVYRSAKPLIELGVIKKLNGSPVKFVPQDTSDVINLLSLALRQSFQKNLAGKLGQRKKSNYINNLLDASFIYDRKNLLESTTNDVHAAKNSIDIVVSGFEIPAEAVLAYKNAAEKGVKIRALVQNSKEVNKQIHQTWSKIGIDVRRIPLMEARIFIFDQKVVYFTSYDPRAKNTAIGIRFAYPPYAILMNDVFEQRWRASQKMSY